MSAMKEKQFDLLNEKNCKQHPGIERLQLGTVTAYKLPGHSLIALLQQQIDYAQSQKTSRWTTMIAAAHIIKQLAGANHGQSPNFLLLKSESHQQSFSITQKALASGQSQLVIACLVTQTLAEQLALQSAARKGNCCGIILDCY